MRDPPPARKSRNLRSRAHGFGSVLANNHHPDSVHKSVPLRLFALALCAALFSVSGSAQTQVGLAAGIANDSLTGKPLASVKIVAHHLGNGADYAAVTGADGIFTFTNLAPGRYDLEAGKEGFQRATKPIQVIAGRTVRVDLRLESVAAAAAHENAPLTARKKQLLERIENLEARLAAVEGKEGEAVPANSPAAGGPPVASLNPAAGLPQIQAAKAPDPPEAPPAPPATATLAIPEAITAPAPGPEKDNFTLEIRFDTNYIQDFNQPKDHTTGGSTEQFRSGEVQIEQVSVGGDFHWQNVRGRALYWTGLFSTATPRNELCQARTPNSRPTPRPSKRTSHRCESADSLLSLTRCISV